MKRPHDTRQLRLVLRTPYQLVLDLQSRRVSAAARHGRLSIERGSAPVLDSLVPGDLLIQAADGSEARIPVGWGLLTWDGSELRITVSEAELEHVHTLPLAV